MPRPKKKTTTKSANTSKKPTKKTKSTKETKAENIKALPPGEPYIKHLVECKCILPQYKKLDEPVWHKFIVFSEIEPDTGKVKPSYAQCPNCHVVHKVNEVGLSKILNKDSMLSLPVIEDIKTAVPEWLAVLLERHECDLPTWQEAEFVFRNKLWGRTIILAKEREENEVVGKYVIMLSERLHKVETFTMFDGFI